MEQKIKKRGGQAVPPEQKRTLSINVRVNRDEMKIIDEKRAKRPRGTWLRNAAFGQLPASIPEINRTAYVELSRAAANLNQLAKHANAGQLEEINRLSDALSLFRLSLLGVQDERNE